MEENQSYDQIEYRGTIEITELIRKYFTPITREIDASNVILRPGTNREEYLRERAEELNKYRNIDYIIDLLHDRIEDGEIYYHKDYDYFQFASKVFFKRPSRVLDPEQSEKLIEFSRTLLNLIILYKEDYWDSFYDSNHEFSLNPYFQNAIAEIEDILNVIRMRDDIATAEIILRRYNEYKTVIIEDTTKVNDIYKQDMFDYYAQFKYQNFLHRFQYSRLLTQQEKDLNIPIKEHPDAIYELDIEINKQMGNLEFFKIPPSCTTDYFERLVETLKNNMSFDAKRTPLYEFLKLVVPQINRYIEDNAHERYKKKDKHLLLFSLLRMFKLVPAKANLEVTGIEDVKEDFIKQLIRGK